MKWIWCVIVVAGFLFQSCKNSPDINQNSSTVAVGPSQPVDSMKQVASGVNSVGAGSVNKPDTITKMMVLPADTIARKNLNP